MNDYRKPPEEEEDWGVDGWENWRIVVVGFWLRSSLVTVYHVFRHHSFLWWNWWTFVEEFSLLENAQLFVRTSLRTESLSRK